METDEYRALLLEQHGLTRRLKARIAELEAERSAPLAVVSTALRLPGGLTTPESYWDFLLGEHDALSEIPEERPGLRAVYDERPDQLGRSYVRRAGFLNDIAGFDAGFFGISQREAAALDPQQRLLLETGWEAMERAGLAVRRQDRLKAGVFVGMMSSEYVQRMAHPDDKSGIDPYYGTGGGHSLAAGRVSYVLGLSGPAISVDTACSSSLVALHLAARSLRQGECRYALVGGANLILSPDLMVSLCQNKALAPDGRSKTFTDAADGYGRGEGVGMVLLMRLDEAEREGRPILAVLRGSAVNHDGASSGLTVPNGPAQQEVLRAALADAGVAASEVGYVEAHGTGTSLGDPIEVGALDAVVGSGVTDRQEPLLTGSVKSRIGHLEAAAGLAGLIKVVLMLKHRRIPAALSKDDGKLNALIPWDRINVAVPRESRDWPAGYQRQVAGLSAFGMSGTNAHVVLEAYQGPQEQPGAAATPGLQLVTLSAKHEESLAELISLAAGHLGRTRAADLAAACHTLRAGRTAFEFRVAVTGSSGAELAGRLLAAAEHGIRELRPSRLTVTLRTVAGSARITEAVAALAAAYPELTVGQGRGDEQLAEILKQFGLKVRSQAAAPDQTVDALLGWEGGSLPLTGSQPAEAVNLLPAALGELFAAGAELRLDALRPAGVRAAGDLPTYPFRRRRLWIEERAAAPAPAAGADATAQGGAATLSAVPAVEAADRAAVSAFLHEALRSLMHAEEDLAEGETFLELGGDSFIAMQLTLRIEETYEIEVPLDDFLEEITLGELFERLAGHILSDGVLIAAAGERQSA